MRRLVVLGLVAAFCLTLGAGTFARAADEKANPDGTWKWSVMFKENKFEFTLKLMHKGDKLTGTLSGPRGMPTKIQDGKFKDGKVSFKVVRKFKDQEFTTNYSGKVTGDTIDGKMTFKRGDEEQSRDWTAKRAKK